MSEVTEKSSEFNELRVFKHGMVLYNKNDIFIGRSLALYGEYSEAEVDFFQQLLKPGDIVVEAGANIGAHTIVLAKEVKSNGMVFAFEPQRIVFQTLCANLALNNLTNVIARQAALGQEAGITKLPPLDYNRYENFGGVSLNENQDGEDIEIQTIDSLQLQRCRLIKADVEGMEKEVLTGAHKTIERLRPILYVENDRLDKSQILIHLIQSFGYRLWWHPSPLFNPENFDNNQENVFGNLISLNMLCVPIEVSTQTALKEITGPEDSFFA